MAPATPNSGRGLWIMVLVVSCLSAGATPASAYIAIALQPIPETIVISDVVAIGKITAKEPKTLNGKTYPDGTGRLDFAIPSQRFEARSDSRRQAQRASNTNGREHLRARCFGVMA